MEIVRLNDISKNFAGVKALSGVSLQIEKGQILAIVGENGAGNILSGTYAAGSFSGEILWQTKLVEFHSPADAEALGITIIHQELSAFPHLTVAENLCTGHWPKSSLGLVDWAQMEKEAGVWLKAVGAQFSPRTRMGDLSTANQQLVEIAKAISRDSKLLILDEPTSSLAPTEIERLFKLLRQLQSEGRTLIYISHKMEEIFALANQVTVLRDGKSVFTSALKDVTEGQLIAQMVGRSLDRLFPPTPERNPDFAKREPVLRVKNLVAKSRTGKRDIGPISFSVRAGEIVGFGGLLGSGRSEIMHAIMGGLDSSYKLSGETTVLGRVTKVDGPRGALQAGIGLVNEDRKRESIFAVRSLEENISMSRLASAFLARVLKPSLETHSTKESLEQLHTRYSNTKQPIRELSGGNQQKVVIARVLQAAPEVIILDEPTRGVDVGAKFEIYQILFQLAAGGKALVVVSSDLPELMALSDRILVISEGRLTGELQRDLKAAEPFDKEEIMRLAIQSRQVVS